MPRFTCKQLPRRWKLSCQQYWNGLPTHRTALLQDAIIHPRFDLEKNWRLRLIIIIPQSQLEPVLCPINGRLIRLQIVRIQLQRVHVVSALRRAQPIIIQLEITTREVPDLRRDGVVDEVFQLESLRLYSVVLSHSCLPLHNERLKPREIPSHFRLWHQHIACYSLLQCRFAPAGQCRFTFNRHATFLRSRPRDSSTALCNAVK